MAGRTIIQTGTIGPSESRNLAQDFNKAGAAYLEAPVLGSIPEATRGDLIVMVGADHDQYARWKGLLNIFGPTPVQIGSVGQAAAVKLALNQLIASLTTAFAVSLGFVQRLNVNTDLFMEILRNSVLYAPTFDKKLQRMLDRHFENPNFPTKHLSKDVAFFRGEASQLGVNTDLLEGIQVLNRAMEQGLAEADYSALYQAVNPSDK